MGRNKNIGADNATVVYGNPNSFRLLIKNHGQLCKIKQALPCTCIGTNYGTPAMQCNICKGTGYIYTYQRRFLIADEDTPCNPEVTELYPYWVPVMEVTKAERVAPDFQGGITRMEVESFSDETIKIKNDDREFKEYERRRVTYFFDGWTHVTGDVLKVDAKHGLMWPTQTFFDAGFQSSNPLLAEGDLCKIERIYNSVTGVELKQSEYEKIGNTIKTKKPIVAGQMVADYFYADLTQIITADLKTKDDLEKWTQDMESGNIRLAMYPWFNITKGDIIVIAADAQYRNELLTHHGDLDQLWELEIFELNDVIMDDKGNTYFRDEDFTLIGNRYVYWISEKRPAEGSILTIKYGYKPSFVCFEDNPEPNNLENRRYPKIIHVRRWSKTKPDDIIKLMSDRA